MALVLALQGNWKQSEAVLERAFDLDPGNPGIFMVAGTVHGLRGERDKAIEDYERAVNLNPEQWDARDNLGRYHLERG